MNLGSPDLSASGSGGLKRRRDEEGEEPKGKKAKFDIGGILHTVHVLAGLRELPLEKHPDLTDLVQSIGTHAAELSPQQKSEILQDVCLIKGSMQGERIEKRAVLRELNALVATLKPSKKRARDEEVAEELPEVKRERSDPLKELHSAVESYLHGTADIDQVLEEVFNDPSKTELVLEKAGHIIDQVSQAQSQAGDLGRIQNFASSRLHHRPQAGDPETLRFFAEAVVGWIEHERERANLANLYTFLRWLKHNPVLDKPEYQSKRADLLTMALNGAEKIKQIADPLMLKADSYRSNRILEVLFHLPSEERVKVIRQLIPFVQKIKDEDHLVCLVRLVAKAAPTQRDELLQAIASLIERDSGRTVLLANLENIPKDERVDVITQTLSLLENITLRSDSLEISTLLRKVGRISQAQRAEVISIAKSLYARQLLTGNERESDIFDLFNAIGAIPRGQRRDVIAHATSVLRGNEKVYEKVDLLRCIAAIPRGQRKAVIAYAAPLFRANQALIEKVIVLDAIAAIRPTQRTDVMAHFTALSTAVMTALEIRDLLAYIATIPHGQRAEVIAQKMEALRPFENIEGWRTLVSEIIRQPLDTIPGIVHCTQSLAQGLTELEDIRYILEIVMLRSELSSDHQEDLVESLNRTLPTLRGDMLAWERTGAFGHMHTLVQAERTPFGYLQNRAGIGDVYLLNCTRQQLEESPRTLLHDLCEQFKQRPLDRLSVYFLGEAGVDAGGLGRQFVAEICAGISGKMGFTERENGLYRPELKRDAEGKFQPLSNDDKTTLQELGKLLMFCLNAAEDYPIGMLFDQGVFEALTRFEERHLTDFESLGFEELFSIYEAMQYKEDDRKYIAKMKECVKPLGRATPEKVLRDAYAAVVDADDAIAALGINNDPKKIWQHYPAIQTSLKKLIIEESIRPVFSPLIEIAKGMKDAPFGEKVSWEAILGMDPTTLSERLQGVVTREMILDKLQFGDGIADEKQEWMKRWIENADDAKIKQFLFAMSGSSSLGRKPLSVEKSGENIHFHTCFNTVDMPLAGIETEELFVSLLDTTIAGKEYSRG